MALPGNANTFRPSHFFSRSISPIFIERSGAGRREEAYRSLASWLGGASDWIGCVACNRWGKPDDENLVMELIEADLETLRQSAKVAEGPLQERAKWFRLAAGILILATRRAMESIKERSVSRWSNKKLYSGRQQHGFGRARRYDSYRLA
jgi:hypothetical protein